MASKRNRFRLSLINLCAALSAVVLSIGGLAPAASAAETPIPAPDGMSAVTAAASCWEVKQQNPATPSGKYWLVTPELGAPEQFYCDQTTAGGGWVLIGRGREDWSDSTEGRGTPADVSGTVSGTAAFSPRQLSTKVITGLANGRSISSLGKNIMLRRATNTSGTSWQDSTFSFSSPRNEWAWAFNNEQRVASWTIGSISGTGGHTSSFGSGTGLNRIETFADASHGNWLNGFGFGSSTGGSTASSSYLWAPNSTAGYARPFTQVFLRPQFRSSDIFAAISDSGTPKREIAPVAESFALPTVWGVAGLGAGPSTKEGSNEVSAFAEGNGLVYVGGNFTRVQRTSSGTGQVAQAYLAAFNAQTGEWVSTFRPTFDNQVKSLAVLPDGRVAAGGYFATVNGRSSPGFVVLNPATGATDTSFTTRVVNTLSGGVPAVRSLDVQGSWLYLGGEFTHLASGSTQLYARSAGRVSVSTGAPASWNPEFNGTVVSLDASSRGDRVYYAGYFTSSRGTSAAKGAAITTDTASVVPWTINFANATANYQQAVKEVGNRVWIGGAQHMLFSYDRANMAELSTNITKSGGDFQAISSDGTTVYGGCHCFHTVYVGARTWSNVGTAWTQAAKINSLGGWDSTTGAYTAQFSPTLSQRNGAGAWALFNDSAGVTWAGGDFTASVRSGWVRQWAGGFVRFARNDTTAPTAPFSLTASAGSTGVTLNWAGSSDNRGSVTYEVLRNDRVVAATMNRSVTLPSALSTTKYFVRATDLSGNRSASTAAVTAGSGTAEPPPPAVGSTLVATASTWSYHFNATAPPSTWNTTGFDSSGWPTGAAPLGWGQSQLGTTLTAADPKPLTSYHRKSFTIADVSTLGSVALTTRADDGIIVYVNGVEVLRRNLDPGPVTAGTYANTAVSASAAVTNPVTVTVPGSSFVSGMNIIAAEVHSNYRATSSHSFELSAVTQ